MYACTILAPCHAPIAVLALIVLCAYLSLFPTLTGWMLKKLNITAPMVWALAAGALWGLSDWLRSVLFTGFPWLTLGYSQAPASPLAGYAPDTGSLRYFADSGFKRSANVPAP